MKGQYRLPVLLFRGLVLHPYHAPASAQLVYLRQARGDAEAPKTGLVDVLGTTETVFGAKAPVVS